MMVVRLADSGLAAARKDTGHLHVVGSRSNERGIHTFIAGVVRSNILVALRSLSWSKSKKEWKKGKRTAATRGFDIGIAEGGARTLDLEVYLSLS
jgi:hypothetical protein